MRRAAGLSAQVPAICPGSQAPFFFRLLLSFALSSPLRLFLSLYCVTLSHTHTHTRVRASAVALSLVAQREEESCKSASRMERGSVVLKGGTGVAAVAACLRLELNCVHLRSRSAVRLVRLLALAVRPRHSFPLPLGAYACIIGSWFVRAEPLSRPVDRAK